MATDIATLAIGVDSRDLVTGTQQLDRMGDQAAETAAALGRFQDQQGRWRESNGRFVSSVDRAAAGLRNVREEAGRIPTPIANTGRAFDQSATAARGFASGGLRQVSMQLSQVAQQGQVTGNYLQAFSIQAADIGMAFGTLGIAAGVAVGALTPLVAQMLQGGQSAEQMAAMIDELAESIGNVEDRFSGFSSGLSGLVAIGGEYAERAREIAQAQREIAFYDAAAALNETADAMAGRGGFNRFAALLGLINEGLEGLDSAADRDGLQRLLENYQGQLDDMAASMGMTTDAATVLVGALGDLSSAEGPAAQAQAAEDVASAFRAAAGSYDEMTAAERQLYAQLLQTEEAARRLQAIEERRSAFISETSAELSREINLLRQIVQYGEDSAEVDRLRAFHAREEYQARLEANGVTGDNLQTIMRLYDQQVSLTGEVERTADAVSRVAGTDLGGFAGMVDRLANSLGIAAGRAERLLNAAGQFPQSSGRGMPAYGPGQSPAGFSSPAEFGAWFGNAGFTMPSTGGGGGGSAQAAQETSAAYRMAEQAIQQAERAAVTFAQVQAELDAMLESGAISAEEYALAIEDLEEQFAEFDGSNLEQVIGDISDALAGAIVNGEDMGEALANVFRQLAQDILSSGIRDALMSVFNVNGGGGGGFFGNILGLFGGGGGKSFAGGGYTGSGPRSGGLDGQGGFLAMLHPQETVIDHARGGGGVTRVEVVARVENGSIVQDVRQIAGNMIVEGISQYDRTTLPGSVNRINRDPRRVG